MIAGAINAITFNPEAFCNNGTGQYSPDLRFALSEITSISAIQSKNDINVSGVLIKIAKAAILNVENSPIYPLKWRNLANVITLIK